MNYRLYIHSLVYDHMVLELLMVVHSDPNWGCDVVVTSFKGG